MKKVLIGLVILLATSAFADFSGEYIKKNAGVDVKQKGDSLKFSINSSVGQNSCNLEGAAVIIDVNSAAYTSADKSDKCVAILNFAGSGLKVTTKDCDGSCGVNAGGSMDGAYKKKIVKK